MAGFNDRDMNGLNDYLNTFMANERKRRELPAEYDGSMKEEVNAYNAREEELALQKEREWAQQREAELQQADESE